MAQYSTEGCNYGSVKLVDSAVLMESVVNNKQMFSIKLDNVAQCVVPTNNANEIEIQFQEAEKAERYDDGLVQITFHFPENDEDNEEGMSLAEQFQREIMNSGAIRSITGNIIAEFSKEQGNFVTPRGKYGIQMMPTYMHMQGAQYAYKIKYDDINSLFLLPKLDGGRMAFVIALEKPIRQGNQKYQNLVLETHKIEHTLRINLTEEECRTQYEGQLEPQMTMPMSSLIAKVFKVLSQKKVFIPKQFISAREQFCVRCAVKANDGLLYPLAKSFIFINKPTIIIKFEDIEVIEFKRYEPNANSATRNFDMMITVKDSANVSVSGGDVTKDYTFMSIDRAEYASLFDYVNSKELKVKNPQDAVSFNAKGGILAGMDLGAESDDEDEEDDDYKAGSQSSSDGGSGSEGSEDEGSEGGGGASDGEKKAKKDKPVKVKAEKVKSEKPEKKRKAEDAEKPAKTQKATEKPAKDEKAKKKRAKKDKNAPKGALTSYILFSNKMRPTIKAENPTMSITDISKEIGARWKTLSAEDKQPFEELAKADKERYQREMKAYKDGKAAGGGDADEEEEDAGGGDDMDEEDAVEVE